MEAFFGKVQCGLPLRSNDIKLVNGKQNSSASRGSSMLSAYRIGRCLRGASSGRRHSAMACILSDRTLPCRVRNSSLIVPQTSWYMLTSSKPGGSRSSAFHGRKKDRLTEMHVIKGG